LLTYAPGVHPALLQLPEPAQSIAFFLFELSLPRVWRHMVPLLVGWFLARQAAVSLVQNLFDLDAPDTAVSFLNRLQHPENPPGTAVRLDRQTFSKDRLQTPLLRHGGPGTVSVAHGDAIVAERNGRYDEVLGPGTHPLRPYEYIRTVLDCRTQERVRAGLTAHTQDGILLKTDMTLVYHIGRGEAKPTANNPYPFDHASVYRAAYAEVILAEGHVETWATLAIETAESKLREVISKFTLDRLLFRLNPELTPHEFVQEKVAQEAERALRYLGVDLEELRLSRLVVPDEVTRQRIIYWQTFWEHRQQAEQVQDVAARQWQLETAKAQAKAQAIAELVTGLRQTAQQAVQLGQPQALLVWRLVDDMAQMLPPPPTGAMEMTGEMNEDETTAVQLHQRLAGIRQQLLAMQDDER
jgi:hypothetical protein